MKVQKSHARKGRGFFVGGIDIDLNNMPITDVELVHASKLKRLIHLQLSNTAVSGAGLTHSSRLTNLKDRYLDGPSATDEGLVPLS